MNRKSIPTWIVVADGARARYFALRDKDGVRSLEALSSEDNSRLTSHSRDAKSDRPGRTADSMGGGVRHAIEPRHDYHKMEKHDFAREVMQFLEKSFDAHQFERLVLVAPHRSLGELRSLLPHKMQASIWHEIGHDFVRLGTEELWQRIAPELTEHVQQAD